MATETSVSKFFELRLSIVLTFSIAAYMVCFFVCDNSEGSVEEAVRLG